ncbi:hypothetical protein [Phaeobacter porticola]|uniref:Carboxymuconolactone decarboxylase-like domain-containing protein n=1 Tax=Phaeobacter porticola TaxID=1844006 RepID=A0A1L3I368_9RHOB|nr:hypothetical protein [Phaeobacter porticola]APG46565.1 hypothetical protein PhaeoP97_01139 [Phaeobacter porticola]
MLKKIAHFFIRRAERRIGVSLDYSHAIADTDLGLLARYNRVFGFLDPNRHVPAAAYHAARLTGALTADCGTCVEAEINLATAAGLSPDLVKSILRGDALEPDLAAVVRLAGAVVGTRSDDPEARELVRAAYGEAGLIELSYAMNGAALLPGIKRAMGYATACDLQLMRRLG